jgi:hypothetical protein
MPRVDSAAQLGQQLGPVGQLLLHHGAEHRLVDVPVHLARRRSSTRANRPATRPINSSNSSCQRAGSTSTLWPAATV